MARAFYLAARLRKYAYTNQFGATGTKLQDAIVALILKADSVLGSRIKGSLISSMFLGLDRDHPTDEVAETDPSSDDDDDDDDTAASLINRVTFSSR
jgi:hypothetical protein